MKRQAYLTVSLDKIGLYAFLAVWVARRGKSSGRRLFFFLYLFFLACAVLFGNVSEIKKNPQEYNMETIYPSPQDPVVLSGTPFLAHFIKYAGYGTILGTVKIFAYLNVFRPSRIESPTPWIYSQLIAANTGMSRYP